MNPAEREKNDTSPSGAWALTADRSAAHLVCSLGQENRNIPLGNEQSHPWGQTNLPLGGETPTLAQG